MSVSKRASDLSPQQISLLVERFKDKPERVFRMPSIPRRSEMAHVPLSFAQQRLWFIDQLDPNSSAYVMPLAYRYKGCLDVRALELAVTEIFRRHEVLRTTFKVVDGHPVQIIKPAQPQTITIIDLSELSADSREAAARVLATEEARRPFDLREDRMLRALLIRLGAEEHALLFSLHHIAYDGWSIGILLRELGSLYRSYSEGEPPALPELPIQYADFARWQRDSLDSQVLSPQLAYWKKQLSGAAPLELPADRPRSPTLGCRGAVEALRLEASVVESLRELAQQEGVTMFMLLLAAFKVLLMRHTGQEDISVGTPISGRNWREIEGLIGFFVNTLVLRTEVRGEASFKKVLRRVREVALEGYTHQDVPFEKLVEELQPERDASRQPLFQVIFALNTANNNPSSGKGGGKAMALKPFEYDYTTTRYDLELFINEIGDRFLGLFVYNTDLFNATTIKRLVMHFQRLLESIIANPDQPVSSLPILSDSERHEILRDWNDTERPFPSDVCLHQLFEGRVQSSPDSIALIFQDTQLSYRELNRRANQLAHHLQSLGVGAETLVGICVERSLEMVVGLLGILKAGGAYVPLDPSYPAQRLALMLEDSQALVLLTQQRLTGALGAHDAKVVNIDTDWDAIARHSADNPLSDVGPSNTAYVIYTSGSTGRPKGVVIEHRSTVAMIDWAASVFSADELASVLASTSICFDISTFELFVTLSVGGRIVLTENALHLRSLPSAVDISLINTVPSAMAELVRMGALPPSVRTVNLAGEPLQNTLAQEIYENENIRHVYNLYGPTEDTTYSTFALVKKEAQQAPPIGRPLANSQTYVLDKRMQPTPVGVAGELFLGGAGVTRGYLRRPELTAERFIPNPFSEEPGARLYRTGDLTRYLPGGQIEYLGRIDHQVKIRGFRIELGEIQMALTKHPAVQDCAVLAREDQPGDKRLVAYVVMSSEPATTQAELRAYLKERLPYYMVPAHFVILEELPLTPNGKLNRRALPPPIASRDSLVQSFTAPRSHLENVLASIFSDLLGVERVGIEDNFFELGGHSLLMVQVHSRLQEAYGEGLSMTELFKYPTVRALAEHLSRKKFEEQPEPQATEVSEKLSEGKDRLRQRLAHRQRASAFRSANE